jgi:Mrp family chromosome partitioning ATPase
MNSVMTYEQYVPDSWTEDESAESVEKVDFSCFSGLIAHVFDPARRYKRSAVMFTSHHRKAGVSFICSNVASELALGGDKVLLADAHALLNLRLATPRSVAASCKRVGPNLWVLGMEELAGHMEGVGGVALTAQIRELEKAFAFVVIDAPALSTEMDAKLMASAVYGTVLVARAKQTTAEEVGRDCQALKSFGGRVLGSVFNAH